jgi:MFS family permease
VIVLHSAPPGTVARVGTVGLAVGVSITLVAIATASLIGLVLGLVVAGVGFVSGFQGAIRTVVALAPAEHRAGVLSVIYLISYVGLSLPAILAGVVAARTASLGLTAMGYGLVVILLAGLAFAGLVQRAHAEDAPMNAAVARAELPAVSCACIG